MLNNIYSDVLDNADVNNPVGTATNPIPIIVIKDVNIFPTVVIVTPTFPFRKIKPLPIIITGRRTLKICCIVIHQYLKLW